MVEQLTSALFQTAAVLIIGGLVWAIARLWQRKADYKVSFLRFIAFTHQRFSLGQKFYSYFFRNPCYFSIKHSYSNSRDAINAYTRSRRRMAFFLNSVIYTAVPLLSGRI